MVAERELMRRVGRRMSRGSPNPQPHKVAAEWLVAVQRRA